MLFTQLTDTMLGLTPAACAIPFATPVVAAVLEAKALGLLTLRSTMPERDAGAAAPPGG